MADAANQEAILAAEAMATNATFNVADAAPVSAADVFNMSTVENVFADGMPNKGQMSFVDATQNADGSYTIFNGGEVWAGPLSNTNEGGSDINNAGNFVRYFNPNTGVFQIQIGGTVPNGAPAENGWPQGYVQGQIVGWTGDSFLLKLYGNIDLQAGQLSDPITPTDGAPRSTRARWSGWAASSSHSPKVAAPSPPGTSCWPMPRRMPMAATRCRCRVASPGLVASVRSVPTSIWGSR
jgi:hypothetical protein